MKSITLNPYTRELTTVTGGKLATQSYQVAISTPATFRTLSPATVRTIRASLEASQ